MASFLFLLLLLLLPPLPRFSLFADQVLYKRVAMPEQRQRREESEQGVRMLQSALFVVQDSMG